jgi:hypothetical protein
MRKRQLRPKTTPMSVEAIYQLPRIRRVTVRKLKIRRSRRSTTSQEQSWLLLIAAIGVATLLILPFVV